MLQHHPCVMVLDPPLAHGLRKRHTQPRRQHHEKVADCKRYCVFREPRREVEVERMSVRLDRADIRPHGEDEDGYPEEGEETLQKNQLSCFLLAEDGRTHPKLIRPRALVARIEMALPRCESDQRSYFLARLQHTAKTR